MIRALIIEDDPMVARFNAIYLESITGFTVVGQARSADEGRKILSETKVDLLLLDVYIGKTTGLDFLIELRKGNNPVDVIVITAANDKESVQTALRYGAVDYLIKPFSFERFQESLLQYKRSFELMKANEKVSQLELDALLLKGEYKEKEMLDLPKGMTLLTFTRIAQQIIEQEERSFSVADLAKETGISQVSIRKYIHYLMDQHFLNVEVIYKETGRPLHRYRLHPEGKSRLTSLISKKKQMLS